MLFNYKSRTVVAIFQPPMLSHDVAVSLTIHPAGFLFATASRSGQIVVWTVEEGAIEAIRKSEER